MPLCGGLTTTTLGLVGALCYSRGDARFTCVFALGALAALGPRHDAPGHRARPACGRGGEVHPRRAARRCPRTARPAVVARSLRCAHPRSGPRGPRSPIDRDEPHGCTRPPRASRTPRRAGAARDHDGCLGRADTDPGPRRRGAPPATAQAAARGRQGHAGPADRSRRPRSSVALHRGRAARRHRARRARADGATCGHPARAAALPVDARQRDLAARRLGRPRGLDHERRRRTLLGHCAGPRARGPGPGRGPDHAGRRTTRVAHHLAAQRR